jgi:hypothetical protein
VELVADDRVDVDAEAGGGVLEDAAVGAEACRFVSVAHGMWSTMRTVQPVGSQISRLSCATILLGLVVFEVGAGEEVVEAVEDEEAELVRSTVARIRGRSRGSSTPRLRPQRIGRSPWLGWRPRTLDAPASSSVESSCQR